LFTNASTFYAHLLTGGLVTEIRSTLAKDASFSRAVAKSGTFSSTLGKSTEF